MAYTAWSVVYGEQPTAAKWNQLGTNDAGFKDGTNIDNLAIINRHIALDAVEADNIKNQDLAMWQSASVQNAGAKSLSASETYDFPETVTLTLARATKILFIGTIIGSASGDTEFRVGFSDNGTQVYLLGGRAVQTHGSRAIDRTAHRVVELAAGSHVLKLRVQVAGGAGMTVDAGAANMAILVGV